MLIQDKTAPSAEHNIDFTRPDTVAGAQFARLVAAYRAACEAHFAAEAEARAAYVAVKEAAPVPEILKTPLGGVRTDAESIKRDQSLTFDQKAAMIAALGEWLPRLRAAVAANGGHNPHEEDEHDRRDATYDALCGAAEAILKATAVTDDDLILQFEVSFFDDVGGWRLDDPETWVRLLTEPVHSGARTQVRMFQTLLRYMGRTQHPACGAAPWDAAAWVEAFEAIPGCEVAPGGALFRNEAWEGYIGDEAFTVTDRALVDAFLDRERVTDPDLRAPWDRGICLRGSDAVTIRKVFLHDPAEAERLIRLNEEQRAILAGPPRGRDLWRSLPHWQQKAARDFARDREEARADQ